MARAGRKPVPTALKILNGNPGKRPIRPEPSAPIGAPEMPKRLKADAAAVAKWKELVPILLSMGTLTVGDGEALATLCEVFAVAQSCLLEFRAGGSAITSDTGAIKPNPAGPLYRGLVSLQQSLMSEFGLTPSSRVRLGTSKEKQRDELEDFFANHGA
jgi:P27 family predicted phage terminase small subunit